MAVHIDASLPVHPLTVDDVMAMVDGALSYAGPRRSHTGASPGAGS